MDSPQRIDLALTSHNSLFPGNIANIFYSEALPILAQPSHYAAISITCTCITPSDVLQSHYAPISPQRLLGDVTTSTVMAMDPCLLTVCPTPLHNSVDTISWNPAGGLSSPDGHPVPSSLDERFLVPASPESADPMIVEDEIQPEADSAASAMQTEHTSVSSHNTPQQRSQSFRCRQCPRVFDRPSRAETCEKNHNGIKDYPCSAECGDLGWYVPTLFRILGTIFHSVVSCTDSFGLRCSTRSFTRLEYRRRHWLPPSVCDQW
jgi:hypothetical protein